MTQEEQVNDTSRTRHSSEHPDVSQSYIFVILFAALLLLLFLLLLLLMDNIWMCDMTLEYLVVLAF